MFARVLAAGSLLLLSVTSAHADDQVAPASPDAKTKLEGNVLVWQDAELMLAAKQPTRTIKVVDLSGARTAGAVVAMKVLGATKDLVHVEVLDGGDCASEISAGEAVRLRFYVARADIAPVVTTPFSATYPDGSTIDIGVGTPTVAANGMYLVRVADMQIPVSMTAASIGFSYRDAHPVEQEKLYSHWHRTPTIYELHAGASASVGGQTLTASSVRAAKYETKGKTALFPVAAPCVRATLAVASDKIDKTEAPVNPLEGVGDIDHSDVGFDPTIPFVPKNTAVFIGKVNVGVTIDRVPLMSKKRPICFDLHLSVDRSDGPTLPACVATSTKLVYNH